MYCWTRRSILPLVDFLNRQRRRHDSKQEFKIKKLMSEMCWNKLFRKQTYLLHNLTTCFEWRTWWHLIMFLKFRDLLRCLIVTRIFRCARNWTHFNAIKTIWCRSWVQHFQFSKDNLRLWQEILSCNLITMLPFLRFEMWHGCKTQQFKKCNDRMRAFVQLRKWIRNDLTF